MSDQDIAYSIIRGQDCHRSGFGANERPNVSMDVLRRKQKLERVIYHPDAAKVLDLTDEEMKLLRAFYEDAVSAVAGKK